MLHVVAIHSDKMYNPFIKSIDMSKRRRVRVRTAKMVGSSNPVRARIARKYSINTTYFQTAFSVVLLTQEFIVN